MTSASAQRICEQILLDDKRYNLENKILRSEIAVADTLLGRGPELVQAYAELHEKLHASAHALQTLLGLVLTTAAFWSPRKIAEARAGRAALAAVNEQIARKATELADLLDQRDELHETSGFGTDTHYHVAAVIEAAAADNNLFGWHVKERLQALRGQFDLKYWPGLSDYVRVLAEDAEAAIPQALDELTAAATGSARASLADFFRALLAAIEQNRQRNHGHLPDAFTVTDGTLAALANCSLGLGPDESVDAPYVKRLRQRHRQGSRQ